MSQVAAMNIQPRKEALTALGTCVVINRPVVGIQVLFAPIVCVIDKMKAVNNPVHGRQDCRQGTHGLPPH
jgi:hypothetical protein